MRPGINDQMTIFFYDSDEEVFIERKVSTLLDILATAGGFSSIIFLVTRIIT